MMVLPAWTYLLGTSETTWQHGFAITLKKLGAGLRLTFALTSCLASKMYFKVPLRSIFYKSAFFENLYWAYLPVPTALEVCFFGPYLLMLCCPALMKSVPTT